MFAGAGPVLLPRLRRGRAVRVLYRPPQKSSDFRLRIFCLVAVQDSNRAALTTPVGRVSNQPSGLLLSPRFPTPRNVYQERCRPTIRSGDFFCGGRYRTRTAAEATAACGGNREPRLGQRSDFSKPCQGAAEKSANATRTGASRQIPSRFPTHRNVYQERCRQTIRSGDFFRGGRYRTRTGTSKGRVSSWRWYPAFCFDMFYQ